ncbi:unnamed protein product [Rotaria sp. Silwood2]|nr:unnamed protein product [Rotaria sp. Silwood2]CAF4149270.1 unnamed protein product [Rotaria sp. Silwood2]
MRIVFFIFVLTISIIQCAIITQLDSNGQGIFTLNNIPISLRGSNYIRLINATIHVTFEPNLYSLWDIESALKQMYSYGYNYVRVFLDCPTLYQGFNLSSPGIPMHYTQNVIDFLVRASTYQIAVMLTASWNPANYQSIVDSYPIPANVTGSNMIIFHAGEAAAKAQFFQDLLNEIQNVSSIAFQTIFAIDIFNEISVSVRQQPFSLTSGIVSFGGVSYNMSQGNDRQQLVDIASNIWLNTVATAIKSIAPTILVSASLFSPNAVGHDGFDGVQTRPPNEDDRYPLRPASLINSLADYIDLHVYASENMRAEFEGAALIPVKPILLGETGAFKDNHPNVSTAAIAIQNVMNESLNYGFVGWGTWTWDTIEQLVLWTLTEKNNTMNNVLAPSVWPYVKLNKTSIITSERFT